MEQNRYSRQMFFDKVGDEGQKRLLASKVVVIGCGALGTVVANLLARAGVGELKLVDRDVVELDNLQRQVLFDEDDVKSGLPKAVAAVEKLKSVNSEILLKSEVCDINPSNVEMVIDGYNLVLDGTDNMETRFVLNDACVKHGVPWVYGAAVGSTGSMMPIVPTETPCLRCIYPQLPPPGSLPTCEDVGVLNTATGTVGCLEVTQAFKILLGGEDLSHELLHLDVWDGTFEKVQVKKKEDCPCCGKGRFDFLSSKKVTWAGALCGRNAVQIRPSKETKLSLEKLKERLAKIGEVSCNGYLLSFTSGSHQFLIFPDGRAIVKGTAEESVAKSLYTRYVGL